MDLALALYDDAIFAARKAIANLGNHKEKTAAAFVIIGRAQFWKEEYSFAVGNLSLAFSHDPASIEAFQWRGRCYMVKKDYHKAVDDFESAVAADPAVGRSYMLLGQALDALGYEADAEEALAQAVRLAPNDTPFKRALITHIHDHVFRLTSVLLHDNPNLDPVVVEYITNAAHTLLSHNQRDTAFHFSTLALNLSVTPNDEALAHAGFGSYYMSAQLWTQALHHFHLGVAALNESWTHTNVALLYAQSHRYDLAYEAYVNASRCGTMRIDFITSWARTAEIIGRREEAVRLYLNASTMEPRQPSHLLAAGRLLMELELWNNATRVYMAAVRLNKNADTSFAVGYAHLQAYRSTGSLQNQSAALAWYKAAVQLDILELGHRLHLADLHLERHNQTGALEQYLLMTMASYGMKGPSIWARIAEVYDAWGLTTKRTESQMKAQAALPPFLRNVSLDRVQIPPIGDAFMGRDGNGVYNTWRREWESPVNNSIEVTFSARGMSDAIVGLSPWHGVAWPMAEIVIGGWSGTQSVIRNATQAPFIASVGGKRMDATEFEDYWIRLDNGVLEVGSGKVVGANVFLRWATPPGFSARCVSFTNWLVPVEYRNIRVSAAGTRKMPLFDIVRENARIAAALEDAQQVKARRGGPDAFFAAPSAGHYRSFAWDSGVPGSVLITFEAKGPSDAFVGISPLPGITQPMWEAVLGSWNNTRSGARHVARGLPLVEGMRGNMLSKEEFRPFWIMLLDEMLWVGSGDKLGENVILYLENLEKPIQARYVGFASWNDVVEFRSISVTPVPPNVFPGAAPPKPSAPVSAEHETAAARRDAAVASAAVPAHAVADFTEFHATNQRITYETWPAEWSVIDGDNVEVVFEARGESDACVVLSPVAGDLRSVWEVDFGGWNNARVLIRSEPDVDHALTHVPVLSITEYRQFWVRLGGGFVSVGLGTAPGENILLMVRDTRRIGARFVSFSNWRPPVDFRNIRVRPHPHPYQLPRILTTHANGGLRATGRTEFQPAMTNIAYELWPAEWAVEYGDALEVVLEARGPSDACVGIANGTDVVWEVDFGAWSNTRVVIRTANGAHGELALLHFKKVLHTAEFRPFWLRIADGVIAVGSGIVPGQELFLLTRDARNIAVKFVSFAQWTPSVSFRDISVRRFGAGLLAGPQGTLRAASASAAAAVNPPVDSATEAQPASDNASSSVEATAESGRSEGDEAESEQIAVSPEKNVEASEEEEEAAEASHEETTHMDAVVGDDANAILMSEQTDGVALSVGDESDAHEEDAESSEQTEADAAEDLAADEEAEANEAETGAAGDTAAEVVSEDSSEDGEDDELPDHADHADHAGNAEHPDEVVESHAEIDDASTVHVDVSEDEPSAAIEDFYLDVDSEQVAVAAGDGAAAAAPLHVSLSDEDNEIDMADEQGLEPPAAGTDADDSTDGGDS